MHLYRQPGGTEFERALKVDSENTRVIPAGRTATAGVDLLEARKLILFPGAN